MKHHAERYKSVFFSDKNFMKLKDLTQKKELSIVDREKSKAEIAELESKYRKFIFENPNGGGELAGREDRTGQDQSCFQISVTPQCPKNSSSPIVTYTL